MSVKTGAQPRSHRELPKISCGGGLRRWPLAAARRWAAGSTDASRAVRDNQQRRVTRRSLWPSEGRTARPSLWPSEGRTARPSLWPSEGRTARPSLWRRKARQPLRRGATASPRTEQFRLAAAYARSDRRPGRAVGGVAGAHHALPRGRALQGKAGAGMHHRRAPGVDGGDDLLRGDSLQVGAGRGQVRVPQLALDQRQTGAGRTALPARRPHRSPRRGCARSGLPGRRDAGCGTAGEGLRRSSRTWPAGAVGAHLDVGVGGLPAAAQHQSVDLAAEAQTQR